MGKGESADALAAFAGCCDNIFQVKTLVLFVAAIIEGYGGDGFAASVCNQKGSARLPIDDRPVQVVASLTDMAWVVIGRSMLFSLFLN
jgi:hypothetical protein